jgi:short-subunit dehydrogenase
VVITGAGSGFGRAFALELARKKRARLILSDRNLEGVRETERLALAAGAAEARSLVCDVTKIADVESLAKEAGDGIDLVVNNAGVASAGRVGEAPLEDWRWTIEVDLFGVIHGCHVFVPILRKQGHGHVLNVASAAGLVTAPAMGAYNVAKAGVIALSETLAGELAGTDIGVTVLCPTFFRTNLGETARAPSENLRKMANKLLATGISAELVASRALASVEKGELHALPMADIRWMWRVKRAVPKQFTRLAGILARRMNV